MNTSRNDPCSCGSGMKYKHCHYLIDRASESKRVQVTQEIYAKSWDKNELYFTGQGCYTWIVDQIAQYKPKRILDIGCGNGHGLLELASRLDYADIISIEENKACISRASKLLQENKYNPTVVSRIDHIPIGPEIHRLNIDTKDFRIDNGISIIEGDILQDDDILLKALAGSGKFDLVTIWMIGTHLARSECIDIAHYKISSSGEYRLRVQNKVYRLADKLLGRGGILQIVDRGEVPEEDFIKDDFIRAHKEQASVTSLLVNDLHYMEYSEASSGRSLKMVETLGLSGRQPDFTRKAMLSITSKKP